MTWRVAAFGGAAGWRRRCRCTTGGARGARAPYGSLAPFDSPKPLRRDALWLRSETGGYGARFRASSSFWDAVRSLNLLLRKLPRITVRGHLVQGANAVAAKSSASIKDVPWGSRRPCGPLAFRRATEGSRVLRRERKPCVPAPFPLLRCRAAVMPSRRPIGTLFSPPPAHRCVGGRPAVCRR